MKTKRACSAPPALTPLEQEKLLAKMGMTKEDLSRPTLLELTVERDLGRLSEKDYLTECEKHGHKPLKNR